MAYKSLQECVDDLDKNGQLIRIKEEVDPYLEMAAIHLRIHEAKGKAVLFEKVKGSRYKAVSNLTQRGDFECQLLAMFQLSGKTNFIQ